MPHHWSALHIGIGNPARFDRPELKDRVRSATCDGEPGAPAEVEISADSKGGYDRVIELLIAGVGVPATLSTVDE